MRHSQQLASSGKIVAEFVPPSAYISGQLLEYVSRRNAALALLQTKVCLPGGLHQSPSADPMLPFGRTPFALQQICLAWPHGPLQHVCLVSFSIPANCPLAHPPVSFSTPISALQHVPMSVLQQSCLVLSGST